MKLFEREFSKFSTGRKSIAYNKEFKKLLNKLQSVSEVESRKEKDIYTAFNKAWDFYSFGKKQELKEYHENDIAKYKKIYENNFSYLYKRRKISAQYHLFLARRLSGLLCSIQSPNI